MRKMKNNLNGFKIKNLLPYIGLISIIVLPWFFKSGYLFFTDMVWGPNMSLSHWTSGWFYFDLIIKILSFAISISLLEKLFIVFVLSAVVYGGYRIARAFTNNKLILFLGSAFALFNPFVYDRLMYGQTGATLSYGFLLVVFGYLLKYYFKPLNKKPLFLASIFAGFSFWPSPHFAFFIILIYLVFGVLIFVKLISEKRQKQIFKVFKYFILSVLIVLAINFNWLYGVFFGNSNIAQTVGETITKQDLLAFKTIGSTPFETVQNVFLMSGFWGMAQFRYESLKDIKENWGRSFYFLLPIIILGLIYNFKNGEKKRLNFALIFIFITAFILALGIALPFTSKITLWLFNNVPFYKGLREPQKWVAVIAAIYEIFLVCGLIELFKKRIVVKHKQLIAFLIFFIILLQAPLLVWGGAGQIKSTNYPSDWYEVDDLIIKDSCCKSKILFLPWHLYMGFKWVGNIIANPSPRFFKCPVIYGKNMEFGGIYDRSDDRESVAVRKWLSSRGKTDLLKDNEINIGYIILAKEVDWRNYLWIEKLSGIEFVRETKNLKVYKVER